MSEQELAELRHALLNAPESGVTQAIAILFSLMLIVAVLWLVKRRKLREEYTPIWLGVALAVFAVTVELDLLRVITRMIGAWTPSSTIFFLGELFLVVICLNYAVRLSRMSVQMKSLAQEVALLRAGRESGARFSGEADA
ncbi:MAG: hypothetical protein CMJ89_10215 [Planctomycetes bacterium]|jgi:hypothetical protein|nr:hypothetical protein [Planctomycetota bacterium]